MDELYFTLKKFLESETTENLRNMLDSTIVFHIKIGELTLRDSDITAKLMEEVKILPQLYFSITNLIDEIIPPFSDDLLDRNLKIIKPIINDIIIERANLKLY